MDDLLGKLPFLLSAMWQRRWIGMAAAWSIALLGALGVVVMRDRYEATARVFVDTETVLKPLLTGIAFQPDVDQQVKMLAKTLISRPNVEQLLSSPKIGLHWKNEKEREKTIDRLIKDIKVLPSGNTNLFVITYRDINPERAQTIVEDLVNLFVVSGVGGSQRDSEQARQFLDTQIKAYEAKLTDSENRLKDFKVRNFGLTGTSNKDYFARMSALSDEVGRLQVELRSAEQARDALKKELAGEDPVMAFDPTAPLQVTAPQSEIEIRIDAQRRQLDDLMRRYTDEHPDVISVKRTLTQLEAQRKAEIDAKLKARGPASRGPAPTSPVFQKIRVALADAEAKVAALRGQLGGQQAQLEQARSLAGKVPQVEAELAQLDRDYEIVRKNYEQLVSKRESASLGEKIGQTTKAAEFRLIEPPRVAPQPVAPSRLMLAMASLVLGVGAGLGVAFALTQLAPTVQDSKLLREITGRPVLGTISLVSGPENSLISKRDRRVFFTVSTLFLVLNIGWIFVVSRQWLN